MIREFFSLHYNSWRTVVILFLFLFQMLGIRAFSGIGFVLSALIFVLLVPNVKITSTRFCITVCLATFAVIFQLLKGSPATYCLLVALYVINAVLLVYYVQGRDVRSDLKSALKIYAIQALLSAIVYIVIPVQFLLEIHWSDAMMQNRTILGMFFYKVGERHMLPFLSIPRISGWAWEPGCLQLLVNLYLCLDIFDKTKIKNLILPSIVIVLTASTTGYVIWMINMLLYIKVSNLKRIVAFVPISIAAGAILLPLIFSNITDKLAIGGDYINGSGVIRMRDLYTGIEEVKTYPLTGIDMTDLANSKQYQDLEYAGMLHVGKVSREWYDSYDYAVGGYCNGFFATHMFWGLFAFFMLYWFLTCRLWKYWSYGNNKWWVIPAIFSLSLVSEPISNTSFFIFLCLYNVLTKKKYYANINSYSHV